MDTARYFKVSYKAQQELKVQKQQVFDELNMIFTSHYLGEVCKKDWNNLRMDAYSITLENREHREVFTISLYLGIGHRDSGRTPTPFDVLACIRLEDPQGDTFEEWCSSYEYSTDSRKALEMYLTCQEQSTRFRKIFPNVNLQAYEPLENY